MGNLDPASTLYEQKQNLTILIPEGYLMLKIFFSFLSRRISEFGVLGASRLVGMLII